MTEPALPSAKTSTVHCTALENSIDSNDVRAWRTLAYKLENALNAERETPPSVETHGEPFAWVVESEYESGEVTVRQRDYHDTEGEALMDQERHGGKVSPLYLSVRPSTAAHAVSHGMYEAGLRYLNGRGTGWCVTDLYLAMEAERVKEETP